MRAVAYSIRSFEKEPLAKANHKKHDITLISNPIGLETVEYAAGKEAVIISSNDHVSEAVILRLADLGVKYITVRAMETDKIDKFTAARVNIQISTVPVPSSMPVNGPEFLIHQYDIAVGTIRNLDFWQDAKNTALNNADFIPNTNISPNETTKVTNTPKAG